MNAYLPLFLAGVAGSMHCLGMCGGFACAMGADPRGRSATLRRHLLYNLGRVTTYCFAGAVVGHLGLLLVGHAGEGTTVSLAQRALALLSGLLLVHVGLQFLGLQQGKSMHAFGPAAAWLTHALRTLVQARGSGAPLALGVLNGLLPCPLVYAFAAQAAGSGGALPGLLTMAAFGLGTFPMMLLAGALGTRLRPPAAQVVHTDILHLPATVLRGDWRQAGVRVAGVRIAGGFIILLGLVTCARGLLPLSAHLH